MALWDGMFILWFGAMKSGAIFYGEDYSVLDYKCRFTLEIYSTKVLGNISYLPYANHTSTQYGNGYRIGLESMRFERMWFKHNRFESM